MPSSLLLGRQSRPWYIELPPKTVLRIQSTRPMRTPFVATTVLGIALLFSQGGNFLIAALCPHLQSGMASCETRSADPATSHEDMGHMGMEHESTSAPELNQDALALGQPHGLCSHCAVHSRTTPRAASLSDTEAAKRAFGLNIPVHVSKVAPATASPIAVLTSRAHGPPGDPTPRHILINIFRI